MIDILHRVHCISYRIQEDLLKLGVRGRSRRRCAPPRRARTRIKPVGQGSL
jgi:hypothetical protein